MVDGGLGRAENAGKQILKDLAKTEPYYKPTKEQKSSSKSKHMDSQHHTASPLAAPAKAVKVDLKRPEDTEIVGADLLAHFTPLTTSGLAVLLTTTGKHHGRQTQSGVWRVGRVDKVSNDCAILES